MNTVEELVYNAVKRKPRLKLAIRNIYQKLFDALPRGSLASNYEVTTREGYFFGFHDHCCFSPDNKYLAAGHFDIFKPLHMPAPDEELEIGYFSGKGYTQWHAVSSTRAWNWHQGCKLQWRGNSNELVFNDHLGGRNIACIVPIDGSGYIRQVHGPVGSVSPSGQWAVGYSFERVEKYMPGYGYRYPTSRTDLEVKAPQSDGIYLANLGQESYELIIPIHRLTEIATEESMSGAHHFVSHTLFSPSSKRFAFLHRWVKGHVTNRKSRIVTSDLSGKKLRVFPTGEMASHLAWRNEEELLAYCRLEDNSERYALFKDKTPVTYQVIGAGELSSDGHPAWSPDQGFFVTDTYPDRRRQQRLILFDMRNERRLELARIPSYSKFASVSVDKHWSCDLHPRWDRTGRYICFDATHSGERALCTLDLGASVSELQEILVI